MVGIDVNVGAKAVEAEVEVAQREAPRFEHVEWRKEPHLRRLYALGAVLMVASATTGYDGSLINTSQQIDAWGVYFGDHVTDANWLGLLTNMFSIGSIVSFFITPYVADWYGRKIAITVGCLFMVLGGFLCAFCHSFNMLLAGRFLLGFGNSLAQMCSPMLLTEICHPQHRGPVTAIYNTLWNAGALLENAIGWGTAQIASNWSWRLIALFQIVPSVVQLAFIYWIPESPRWLVSRDRGEEALTLLATHHAGGDRNNSTVQFEYREIRDTLTLEKEAGATSSYMDFLRTRGNRWRLIIVISVAVISQYSGNALFSNYINAIYTGAGITEQNQKLGLSVGQTALNLGVTVYVATTVDRFGRRPLFLVSVVGMVACFACWTICGAVYDNSGTTNAGAGYAQLVFIWIFGIFYDIGFSGLLVAYSLEVLPFRLRAKGMMIMNLTVQAILALSAQTNLLAWERLPHHWNLMLFYTLWDLVELVVVYIFFVETKGPTLEEIARIFDGDDAAVAHISLNQVQKELAAADHEDDVVRHASNTEKTAA